MTNFVEARNRVLELLADMSKRIDIELALEESATRVEPWCWVFFYNSRAYIETGSFSQALAGNAPIVIDRATGRLHELTTARSIDDQLEELRRADAAESR